MRSMIRLQSCDGEVFEVEVKIARVSVAIRTMLEDLENDPFKIRIMDVRLQKLNDQDWPHCKGSEYCYDEDEEEIVPLPNVNAAILKKVIEWATHHKDDPPPPADDENREKRTDDVPTWDAEFLKLDQGTLFELIMAANYLDMKGLLDVTCKTVANMIKGKTPEEIRKTFNIKNDFTPSEELQLRKETEWCE